MTEVCVEKYSSRKPAKIYNNNSTGMTKSFYNNEENEEIKPQINLDFKLPPSNMIPKKIDDLNST